MNPEQSLLPGYMEVHDANELRRYFEKGGDPNEHFADGIPIFTLMVEMYTRTSRFKECVQAFIDHGLHFQPAELLSVFIDDGAALEKQIKSDPLLVNKTYALFNNTYTSLIGATLLHFCAEYNSVSCARVLVNHGADINARAAFDEHGFGGHTPVFHTVNQNLDNSKEMLQFLLDQGVDLSITVKGLIWAKGYDWETFIPAVNPLSYAMMGLLPQMHRKPVTVAKTISLLLKYAYGLDYHLPNVPNTYLK